VTSKESPPLDEIPQRASSFLHNLPQTIRKVASQLSHNYWKDFQSVYMKSGINTYIDDYIRRMKIILGISVVALFTASCLIFGVFLKLTLLQLFLAAFAITLIGSAITGFTLIYYPHYKSGEAKSRLEDGLIYFLSYMAVLSASGMSIERILERITTVEDNPPLIHLAKKFMINVRLFGMDVRTALKDVAEMSPSKILAKNLEGIRTVLATSGDLKSLLVFEVDRQLQIKKEKLKSKLNSLVYIGEIYVALMVITPTSLILIISILSILGANTLGGSAVTQMNLIVFIGIPILGAIFTILLDQTLGREE
jgi:flagellar protein FlaJ